LERPGALKRCLTLHVSISTLLAKLEIECDAHRNNMDIEISLSALLFAPFRELRVPGGDESKSFRGVGGISHLERD
jgi:hypothetical protein